MKDSAHRRYCVLIWAKTPLCSKVAHHSKLIVQHLGTARVNISPLFISITQTAGGRSWNSTFMWRSGLQPDVKGSNSNTVNIREYSWGKAKKNSVAIIPQTNYTYWAATEVLEWFVKLIRIIYFIASWTCDRPACSIVPQRTTLPLDPRRIRYLQEYEWDAFLLYTAILSRIK
jgi:hypothetical protein